MSTSFCSESAVAQRGSSPVVCLAGNPNVGKSSLFNRLTGAGVETANYAGMTVAAASRPATWEGRAVDVVDLPGAYAVDATAGSSDQAAARQTLLELRPDVVVAVVDATNVARNLYLVLQLLDLDLPVVVALNLMDEARRRGREVDAAALSAVLRVPVVATVGNRGEGVGALKKAALAVLAEGPARSLRLRYSDEVEARLAALEERLQPRLDDAPRAELPFGLSARALALASLEGDAALAHATGLDDALLERSGAFNGMPLRVARERHAAARAVAESVAGQDQSESFTRGASRPAPILADRLWRAMTAPLTGVPILLGVVAGVFAFLFVVGGWLSTVLTDLWVATAAPVIVAAVHSVAGTGPLAEALLWGLNGGILATLAVGIPYILTFYFVMALLEDTGYLNAAAYLSDRLMHRFGLHGRAVIPLIAAGGCNVPAIMATRTLTAPRQRLIASTLVVLVPCSARSAVILGAVSLYAGWQWALFVYGVLLAVGVAAGVLLNRLLPGDEGDGLVMEVFPLRRPSLRLVVTKTWRRFGEFAWVAAPIIFGGSIALGVLYETGLIWHLAAPLEPVVGWWLGLPAVAGLTLIFAVLRKELALQLLVAFAVVAYGPAGHDLSHFMTTTQLVVYGLVSALYVPCLATVTMLARELGWRRSLVISAGTVATALLVGGAVAHVLPLLALA